MPKRFNTRPRSGAVNGFTLIELLGALVVFALLSSLVTSGFADWIAAQRLANHARHLAESMEVARSAAIKSGSRVNLCKSRNGRQCADDGGWEAGWLMFIDDDHDGDIGGDEQILRIEPPAEYGITVRGNRPVEDYISYTSLGHARLLNGGLQMGTLIVCKSGQNALNVVLANSGRTRIDKTHNLCG